MSRQSNDSKPLKVSKHPALQPIDASRYSLSYLRSQYTKKNPWTQRLDFINTPDEYIEALFVSDRHRNLASGREIVLPPRALRKDARMISTFLRHGRLQKEIVMRQWEGCTFEIRFDNGQKKKKKDENAPKVESQEDKLSKITERHSFTVLNLLHYSAYKKEASIPPLLINNARDAYWSAIKSIGTLNQPSLDQVQLRRVMAEAEAEAAKLWHGEWERNHWETDKFSLLLYPTIDAESMVKIDLKDWMVDAWENYWG